jgi:PAS domain S-box-containing protein
MSGARILVVEDERIVALDIVSSLKRMGHTVPAAVGSGEAALRDAERLRPDLVLMDIGLSGAVDGVEAARQIREHLDLPVIYLTAHADEATLQRAKVTGPVGYLLKPFDERDLRTAIEMALHRHRMERELREGRQWFATTLQSLGDAVLATDGGGAVKFLNPAAVTRTGWTQDEAVGRACGGVFRAVQEQTRAPVESPAARVLREGAPVVLPASTLLVARDGRERPISGSAAPLRDARGNVLGAAQVFRDETERRQLEEQLRQAQKLEAVGRLAGGIAHDFNNLLTIINGYCNLVLSGTDRDSLAYGLIEEVLKAGNRAASLTHQLLAFSRKQVLQPVVLDLNEAVASNQKMLRRLIGEDVALVTDLAPGLRPIRADPGQVEQVLLNLAVNARDAMPRGGTLVVQTANVRVGEAGAEACPELPPGPYVRLEVRDTGTGMDAATLAHMFEPFFTTKGPGRGTGLGLATVYGIVKQSNGHIRVTSAPGRGTTFTIYFPPVDEAAPLPATRLSFSDAPRGHETVLVGEDEGGVRGLICQILAALGYTVREARSGADALALADRHEGALDLLVTDVVMPGMSGRERADRLLAVRPGLKVLFLSGYLDDAILRYGIQTESTPFVQKPFSPQALARKVRELLGTTPD